MTTPKVLAGRYELSGLLGRGGMGEVYDGWDRRLDRPVAVKLLSPQLAEVKDIRLRFETEAQAAASMVHPNVVGVYDTGEQDGTAYIVMERLPGRSLADELAAGPLAQERVRRILRDMLEGLAFAHRKGILHRDIKPSNVLLTERDTAKIADFGIAKTAGQNLTQTGQFIGTAAYLSPERLNGLPAGPESDLYSVGVVGYEALAGEKPFDADTPIGLVRAIADGPTPSVRARLPGVEEDLAGAIDTAIRRRPEDRFTSAEQMLAALSPPGVAGSHDETTAALEMDGAGTRWATPPVPAVAPAQPVGRRWLLLAGALAGAFVVLLLVLRLTAGDDPPSALPQPAESPQFGGAGTEQTPAGAIPISDVSRIEFLGPGTVVIEQTGGRQIVTVEAPQALRDRVITDAAGDLLTVGLSRGSGPQDAGSVVFRITVRELRELRALGAGRVEASGITAGSLTVDNAGSAVIELSGEAEALNLTLNGSGDLQAGGFIARQVFAELNGSGSAVVAVSHTLTAELRGSGNLRYLGDPAVTQDVSGSGRVHQAG
ncbi:MAG TPA: protein kinase [Actinomycetota bacterium]|nr:protein kinase [Actinomycetota bacterium]